MYGGYGSSYGAHDNVGGFRSPASAPPPPPIDPQIHAWFMAVDRDRSGHISAQELQKALMNGDWTPFDLDTVKLLMGIFDTDHSGTIGVQEFAGLWKYIQDWQGVFKHFDRDRSGAIGRAELSQALASFGFPLSDPTVELIIKKYGAIVAKPQMPCQGSAYPYGPPNPVQLRPLEREINFDRFVRACVVVRQATEAFQREDQDRDGVVQLSYDKLMGFVLALP